MIVPLEILVLAFAAAVLLAFMPGMDNRAAFRGYGITALVSYTSGLCIVILVVTLAAALGAAVMPRGATVVVAFVAIMTVQALLRPKDWRPSTSDAASSNGGRVLSVLVNPAPPSNRTLFRWGVAINSASPKVAILFLTFLPLTNSASGPEAIQILLLGAAFISANAVVFGIFPYAASHVGMTIYASLPEEVTMNRITAGLLLLLTIRMFLIVQ